jgi:hypothetical protein
MNLLMAAASHGPGMHGAVVNVILIVLALSAMSAVLVHTVRFRKRAAEQSERDQGRGA